MVRIALLSLAALVALLVGLALLPERERAVPDEALQLRNASIALYPQRDPSAVWRFEVPEASYDPDRRETTLRSLERGARLEGGAVDFRVRGDAIVIDADEDLRSDGMRVRLEDDGTCLVLQGSDDDPVRVDQGEGVFRAPLMQIQGEDWGDSRFPNVVASFDLNRFEAGGAGTTTVTSLYLEGGSEEGTACDDFEL